MRCWKPSHWDAFLNDWIAWANRAQLPPEGAWRAWLFMGGRGAGKTRAGAEWVSFQARQGLSRRIALIAPTFRDVREVMIDGESGLLHLKDARPVYEPSRARLIWPNGAQAHCFSAEDPESLRGPQFDAAWCDELAYWAHPERTLATLEHALRLGREPKMLVTTTPRPIQALIELSKRSDVVTTRSSTWENAMNLAPGFVAALQDKWRNTRLERQELNAELIEEFAGALWRRAEIETLRRSPERWLERVVVAVDPPASVGAEADACGIIAAGAYGDGAERRAIVLADASVQGLSPQQWAERAAALARSVGADAIVAEANNGGEMVRAVLRTAAPDIPVRLVHASAGKRARAEPIAALYEQGRITHAAAFAALEDEMCAFGAEDFRGSPDRVDALVWALTIRGARPSRRSARHPSFTSWKSLTAPTCGAVSS